MSEMNSSPTTTRAAYTPSAPPLNQPQPSAPPPPPDYNYSPQPPPHTPATSLNAQYGGEYSYAPTQPQPPPHTPATSLNTQYGGEYSYAPAQPQPPPPYGQNYHQYQPQPQQSLLFPPGTDPEIVRSFQMVDRDTSGYIEEKELQQALTSSSQIFGLKTIRLLIFLFKNQNQPSLRIGPQEFTALWSCLGQWRAIFERFDRDRSGKIDTIELRDALHSLGYAIPQSVLQVLISRYDNGSGNRIELNFDEFIECGMVVKGLTDKFKEKDTRYTGSAMLHYDQFMSMIIPFLVSD